jgi:hypothetical protein
MSLVFDNIDVEESISGIAVSIRNSVIVASTGNGNLANDFENGKIIDGITLVTGNRLLLKDQTNAIENGIYTVQASGVPLRSEDASDGTTFASVIVFVQKGTQNKDTSWLCTNDSGSDIIGSDPLSMQLLTSSDGVTNSNTAVDNAIATFDGVDGKKIKSTNTLIGTNGNLIMNGSNAYIDLPDITAPSNPGNGMGRLYKKTGNDGLFWKPDLIGAEVDLTETGGGSSIDYYFASATSSISTTSNNYVQVNSMTLTPPSGTYKVSFSCYGVGSTRNSDYSYAIFINNSIVNDAERIFTNRHDDFITLYTQSIVTVNGSQSINIRWKAESGRFNIYTRNLILLKL